MKTLTYYLKLAEGGNAAAAYEAAKIMYCEKYNDVIVQSTLRKAAALGSVDAQRWLGFICLAGKQVSPGSTASNIQYTADLREAYTWFERAAAQGDTLSAFAVYKCLQHGIGIHQDTEKADAILEAIAGHLDYDVLPLMFFFDTYKDSEQAAPTIHPLERNALLELLAS